jgi:Domain of unknown function (DUF5134)
MSIPAWIPEILAVVMLLAAEVSAGQLVVARAWTRRGGTDADMAVSQVLMGIAMAGVLLPGLSTLPNVAWEGVFALMTAWFAWRLWRESRGRGAAAVARGRYAPHLVFSAAMLYVFAALAGPSAAGSGTSTPGPGGMPGMAGGSSGGVPTPQVSMLALVFALLLIAFTVHDLDRRAAADPAAYTAERLLLSPALVKGGRVATGVTMAFILITMI